jgi:predicted RNA-binding protein with PUA-like domain
MAYWLFKSEPETWSWEQQKKAGAKGEPWTGVRNHLAQMHMKAMKTGDRGFFYHSVKEKSVVGVVEVVGEYRPDHTDASGRFGLVVIKAVKDMPNPVMLDTIKGEKALADMVLVKNSRLSVQPVTDAEWKRVCQMGGFA